MVALFFRIRNSSIKIISDFSCLIGIILLFLFVASCVPKTPPKIAVPEETKTKIIQRVEYYLRKHTTYIHTAKGYAKVKLKIKSKRESFDAVVIINLNPLPPSPRPSPLKGEGKSLRFRFETLDDLGNTKHLIVSDGKILSWKDFSRDEYDSTELSEKNLRKFLPLANSIEETLGLMIGRMPKLDLSFASVYPSPPPSPPSLMLGGQASRGEGEQIYRIEFSQGELIWNDDLHAIEFLALKNKNGKLTFKYEAENFKQPIVIPTKETRATIPSQIKLVDLKTKNEIEIDYKILEVGMRLPFADSLFELEP